ncbi:MAG: RDD family protein [Arenimonas sp.]
MSYTPSPAGFWKRYAAYFIDIVILYIGVEILSTLFFSFQSQSAVESLRQTLASLQAATANGEEPDLVGVMQTVEAVVMPALIFSTVAYFLLAGAYFSVMESSRHQATIGKRMVGIKVTNAKGEPIGLPQSIGRFLASSLSWFTMNLGHALAAWTPERRALHDYLADTRVENTDPAKPSMPILAWVIITINVLLFVGGCAVLMVMMWMMMQEISAI